MYKIKAVLKLQAIFTPEHIIYNISAVGKM
jgi:hypothetical protein